MLSVIFALSRMIYMPLLAYTLIKICTGNKIGLPFHSSWFAFYNIGAKRKQIVFPTGLDFVSRLLLIINTADWPVNEMRACDAKRAFSNSL